MDRKVTQVYITRIARFKERLAREVFTRRHGFEIEFARSKEPVPFSGRSRLAYESGRIGQTWGRFWDSAWFRLRGSVPASWQGGELVAHLDFGGEGLVFDRDGFIRQGITNGSVFDGEFNRDIVPLVETCAGGEEIELWVETAANGLFGMFTEADPAPDSPKRYGAYEAKIEAAELCLFDRSRWHLWLDLRLVEGLIRSLPESSVRRARLIRAANDMIDAISRGDGDINFCRRTLTEELQRPATASALTVTAVGHAHIDTAWLWPVRESIRKCARTFSTQLALIDRYPDYIFGASQAQHYAFVKEHYPELYERIKAAVAAGRWEIQGGMWVEADCNLISGEAMVRQVLLGKNFFLDEFGVEVDNLWLPDVFGYSAAMPQILRRSDIDCFLTQKLSWSQFNRFPHHSFIWRGIDGSEVLTHFPPEDTYNSQLDSDSLRRAEDNFEEKGVLDEFLCLFGVGDGGGGPKEENIELGLRQVDCEGAPKLRFGSAKEFFARLRQQRHRLDTWAGELYLELHRGTLTTQAQLKQANRRLETTLGVVETLWSCLPLSDYPREALDRLWKIVLKNQFHDILPGSSITSVYTTALAELAAVATECRTLIDDAGSRLFEASADSLVLFNPTHYPYRGPLELPSGWQGAVAADGKALPAQIEHDTTVVSADLAPYSFTTLTKGSSGASSVFRDRTLMLENDRVRYEFETDGTLVRGYDKTAGREFLEDGARGNLLSLYDDHPNDWDAWDIDLPYENTLIETASPDGGAERFSGAVRQGITFALRIGESTIAQVVTLAEGSKRLDFDTTIDWREAHRMLRVSFPVDVHAAEATFDIQYGYVKRPTHRNTSWDLARFEVVGHRYADLSDGASGVALLNDSKYGYKVYGNVLDLNLLRAPTYPDPDADRGTHRFTYSLLPHEGSLMSSDVLAEATALNTPPVVVGGYAAGTVAVAWRLDGEGLVVAAVKKAEKDECLVLRIVETHGCRSTGTLHIDQPGARLVRANLMERDEEAAVAANGPIELTLEPFEIRTYKLMPPQ